MKVSISEILDEKSFIVGFNRVPNGQDVSTRIDITVSLQKDAAGNAKRVTSDATLRDFAGCMGRLFDLLQAKLDGKPARSR